MLLIKNLNVADLDKNFFKEFETPSASTTINELLSQIASTLNLNHSKLGSNKKQNR
jgi:hypothetical protein